MRASFLGTTWTEVLFTAKAVAVVSLLVSLTERECIEFVDAFDLMALQDLSPVMVCTASLAKIEPLSPTIQRSLLVLAAHTDIVCRVEVSLLPNCEVCLVAQLILIMRAEEEIELTRIAVSFWVDQDGLKTSDVVPSSAPASQRYSSHEECEHFIGLALCMDVDMSAKDHQILQWDSFAAHSIDIIFSEVSGVDDGLSAEDLFRDEIVGEAEEGDEFDGGLACDQLELIVDLGPFARSSLDFLSHGHRYNSIYQTQLHHRRDPLKHQIVIAKQISKHC